MKFKITLCIVTATLIIGTMSFSTYITNKIDHSLNSVYNSSSSIGVISHGKIASGIHNLVQNKVVIKDLKITPKLNDVDPFLTIVFPSININVFKLIAYKELDLHINEIGIESNNSTVIVSDKLNTHINISIDNKVLSFAYNQRTPEPGITISFDAKISNFALFDVSLLQTDINKAFETIYQYQLDGLKGTMCDEGAIHSGYFRGASSANLSYEGYVRGLYKKYDTIFLKESDRRILKSMVDYLVNLNSSNPDKCITIKTNLDKKLNFIDLLEFKTHDLLSNLKCDISTHN